MKIKGSLALVTGASRGIGAATARTLAKRGARLILLARSANALEELANEIIEAGGEAKFYAVDLADSLAVERVIWQIKTECGIPSIIINNAGTGSWLFIEETSPAAMLEMMSVPYFAAFLITQAFMPELLQTKHGHIVNVTSAVAFRPIPGATAYNAAAWAVRGFTEALRADLHGTGINISLLASGTVSTPNFEHYPNVVERMPKILNIVPILTPEKVANAIVSGIEKNQRLIIIPFMMRLLLTIDYFMPFVTERLMIATGWKHK